MAIFENSNHNRYALDDTENFTCILETTQNIDKHTEYILRVQRGPVKDNKWNVSHRYRDFAALHNALQQSGIELKFPPKKLIGNMQPSFIAERQVALQKYINEVLKHQILSLSLQVRCFLDPKNYPSTIADQALQTVSIALRGNGQFELKGPLPYIGWRIRKQYFLVTEAESKKKCLLSYQSYGPDKYLCDKDIQSICKSLVNLSHPYIDKILAIQNLESGAYVIRNIHEKGTLRDMIYGTEYSGHYLSKYGNPKVKKPLTSGQVRHYSIQILDALQFLHDKGLFHGHLHPGNIVIENQRVLLTEVENSLCGTCSVYRPFIVQLRHVDSMQDVDVYCFGRTLYEMAFAEPLQGTYFDTLPNTTSHDEGWVLVWDWLNECVHRLSAKHGFPSVTGLMEMSRGDAGAVLGSGLGTSEDRPRLKLPPTAATALSHAALHTHRRIINDQKLVRNARREERIQGILNSAEEFKKHKRKAKKRESMWKSSSTLAETARSPSTNTASVPMSPNTPGSAATSPSTSVAHFDSSVIIYNDEVEPL